MNSRISRASFRGAFLMCGLVLVLALSSTALAQEGVSAQHSTSYWQAAYWNNTTLSGVPVLRQQESGLNYNWGLGSPHPRVAADGFSARWTRYIDVTPGTYRFTVRVDDGVRVWVDDDLVIDQWRDHWLTTYSATRQLTSGRHLIKVEYYERAQSAAVAFSWTQEAGGDFLHWRGEYYNNKTLSGAPTLVRDDNVLNFYWGNGSPAPGRIGADGFSVRWTRDLVLPAGNHRFAMTVDDGGRLWVNKRLLIDAWKDQARRTYYGDIYLPGGSVAVKMEYYESTGSAQATLAMSKPSPEEWKAYANRSFAIELQYPGHWQRVTELKYAGTDGFFRIDAMDGDSLDRMAQSEANHVLRPYGSHPSIEALSVQGQDARLILPSADQPAGMDDQSALLVRYPRPVPCGSQTCRYIMLNADKGHIRAIAETLRFKVSAPPNPGPSDLVIVDDSDQGFVKNGTASYWRTALGGYDGGFTWTKNNDRRRPGYNWARWYPDLAAGHYEVFVHIPQQYATTKQARYWVSHLGGYTLRLIDQSANGGRWVSLGDYMFRGTRMDHVSLSDVTYEPYVSRMVAFDAVKWVRLP